MVKNLAGHESSVSTIDTLSNGQLITGDESGVLKVWQVEKEQPLLRTIKTGDSIQMLIASLNNFAVCGMKNSNIEIWDPSTGSLFKTLIGHASYIYSLATFRYSLRNNYLASGSNDTTVIIWDISAPNPLIAILKGHTATVNSLTELPSGQLASGSDDATIVIWDEKTWTQSNVNIRLISYYCLFFVFPE